MPENKAAHFPVKWLITIVDRGRGELAAELRTRFIKRSYDQSGQGDRQF